MEEHPLGFVKFRDAFDSTLWCRGYAQDAEGKLAPGLDKTMARLKVQHIVAAHSITDSRRIPIKPYRFSRLKTED